MTHPNKLVYSLQVLSRSQHLFGINLSIPAIAQASLTLSLPAWIPGSYMIRDFAKNIVSFDITDNEGNSLPWKKVDKQTWCIETQGKACTVAYQVYAFDLSVRSAYLNDEYGFINGTSAFLGVKGYETRPCEVIIKMPEDAPTWQLETTLPKSEEQATDFVFTAENYDELIDHPIFMGECISHSFYVDGVEFVLLFSGSFNVDCERLSKDLTPICQHHFDLFEGTPPIKRYVFMTLVADKGYGGLEHRSSTALMFPRFDLPLIGDNSQLTEGYVNFLSLCCHELFHTWHVKRIKPSVMVTPNLEKETYTDQLWIYEGFTSYYDDLAVARAGAIPAERYCQILAQHLTRLKQNTGRFKQSISESSFDAWTRFYQQDASAVNNIVSYYNKGGIVAMGLDLYLRQQSNNQVTLDSVMRVLWDEYGKEETGTPDTVIADICRTQFNLNIDDYLQAYVYGTQDVPLTEWVGDIGLSISKRSAVNNSDKGGKPSSTISAVRQLGAVTKNAEFGVHILQVREHLAADQAGLQVNDRIIGVDGWQVDEEKLQRLLNVTQKDTVPLVVARDGRILTLTLPLIDSATDRIVVSIEDEKKFAQFLAPNWMR